MIKVRCPTVFKLIPISDLDPGFTKVRSNLSVRCSECSAKTEWSNSENQLRVPWMDPAWTVKFDHRLLWYQFLRCFWVFMLDILGQKNSSPPILLMPFPVRSQIVWQQMNHILWRMVQETVLSCRYYVIIITIIRLCMVKNGVPESSNQMTNGHHWLPNTIA